MAALPPIKQVRMEDILKSDGSPDMEKLVAVLNQFMGAVHNAFNRQLTFDQNFRAQIKVLPVQTGPTVDGSFPITFALDGITHFRGAVVLSVRDMGSDSTSLTTGASAQVIPTGRGQAEVRYISGLDANSRYQVVLLLIE